MNEIQINFSLKLVLESWLMQDKQETGDVVYQAVQLSEQEIKKSKYISLSGVKKNILRK